MILVLAILDDADCWSKSGLLGTSDANLPAAVVSTPNSLDDWADCDEIGKLVSDATVYDGRTEIDDCSDSDCSKAPSTSKTFEATFCPIGFDRVDALDAWAGCEEVIMLVSFAADAAVPDAAEMDEWSDCDVGKVQARKIGPIDRRLKQVLGNNIFNTINEDTLCLLHSFLLRRDSRTND